MDISPTDNWLTDILLTDVWPIYIYLPGIWSTQCLVNKAMNHHHLVKDSPFKLSISTKCPSAKCFFTKSRRAKLNINSPCQKIQCCPYFFSPSQQKLGKWQNICLSMDRPIKNGPGQTCRMF